MYMKENEVDICVPAQESTLEWVLPSPPPLHCFEEPPITVYCTDDTDCKWVNPGAH
jgi:heme/copper-type cytochrome/quinol oxidase subunit 1